MSGINTSIPNTSTNINRDNSEAIGNIAVKHVEGDKTDSSFLSKIWEFMTKWLETLYSGIFEDPLFIVNKVIGKKMALSLIYLGLILSLMQVFNPKNNYAMFYLYAICFWIVALILSIWIIDPYDESNIEYALRNITKKPDKEHYCDKSTNPSTSTSTSNS
jgi:hypothetical protein